MVCERYEVTDRAGAAAASATVISRLSSHQFKFASLLSSQKIVEKSRFNFYKDVLIFISKQRSYEKVMNRQLMQTTFSLSLHFQNHLPQFSLEDFKGSFQFVIINSYFILHVGAQQQILNFKNLIVHVLKPTKHDVAHCLCWSICASFGHRYVITFIFITRYRLLFAFFPTYH